MIIYCESCQSTFQLDSSLVKPTGSKVRCSKCQKIFKVYPLEPINRRKYPRVQARNLISYFSFDEDGTLITHGMGITLDISKGGILFETPCPIGPGLIVLATTDLENNLIEVKGKLVYCIKTTVGTYHSGIKFVGIDKRVTNFITKLIKSYNYQGYNLFIAIAPKIKNLQSKRISR